MPDRSPFFPGRRASPAALTRLPDTAVIHRSHGLTGLAGERMRELRHIYQHTLHAQKIRRVRVDVRQHLQKLRPLVGAPVMRVAREELLFLRVAFAASGYLRLAAG